jgi:hypothetical protein
MRESTSRWRNESISMDFHELRQDFSPLNLEAGKM